MRRSSFDGGVYLKVVRDIFRIKRTELMPFLLWLFQGRGAYSSKYVTCIDVIYWYLQTRSVLVLELNKNWQIGITKMARKGSVTMKKDGSKFRVLIAGDITI